MATIRYNITAGAPPFTVTITPAVHAPQNHSALGNYFFTNIPDNNYTIEVTDSVGCNISFNVSVQCNTTTTTTQQETTTTTTPIATTTTTTHADLPALKACLDDALIYEGTLSFTPPSVWYGGVYTFSSNIVEDSNYIFIVFNDTTDNDYEHHIVWRYNKSTEAIATKTITTTNSYCCDYHKVPAMLISSSGTLLVAIEQLLADSNHNNSVDIFRWADPSDLDTYSTTTVGNSSTERLSYMFLFEKEGNIILEARRYETPLIAQWRVYYTSNDDGQTFSSVNSYLTYGDSDYWMYTGQVGNNNLSDIILQIRPSYYTTSNIFQYITFLKTDFTGNFYSLNGTDLGTSITGAELVTYSSWGDTTKNTNYYFDTFSKIFGNYIYLIGYIGTKISGILNIISMQIAKININNGNVTTGGIFNTKFPSTTAPPIALFNICDDMYAKISYDGIIYYYKVAEDLNSIDLVYTEGENYHLGQLTNLHTELTADYDTSTKTLRIFRMSDPDIVWNFTTTTTTTGLPISTTTSTTGVPPVTTTTTTSETTTTTTTTCIPNTLKTSLISSWELDEASGTTVNDSHGSNDGTSYNCIVNQTGAIGKAYNLNGTSSYISIPSTDFRFNPLTESYSVSAWVKSTDPTPSSVSAYLLSYWDYLRGHSYPFSIQIKSSEDDLVQFVLYDGSDVIVSTITGDSVWDGDWHLITMVVNHSTSYVYAYYDDANLADTKEITFSSYSANATESLDIGCSNYTPSNFYCGLIDQIRVWNKALSTDEISDNYNSGNGLSYYCLDEATTTTTTIPTTTTTTTTTEEGTTTTTT